MIEMKPILDFRYFVSVLLIGFLALSMTIGFPAFAKDEYPNLSRFGGMGEEARDTEWYRQCLRVKSVQPPAKDKPSFEAASKMAKCDASDLYYDTRATENASLAKWRRVRHCAFATNDHAVLMMLYANGYGVEKDLRYAMKEACLVGGAPFEIAGRVNHLARLLKENLDEDFDLCDDITSGLMQGQCEYLSERQYAKARNVQLGRLISNWSLEQKMAYGRLWKALNEFALHRANDETDLTGTARSALAIRAEAAERDQFADDLEALESRDELDAMVAQKFEEQDGELNRLYQKLMRVKTDEGGRLGFSTINKTGVRNTQRVWLKYRDAWAAVLTRRYPQVDV